jgi:hypothetical protein
VRLIIWGAIMALAAGGLTWLIFWVGHEYGEHKARKAARSNLGTPIDTPGWKPENRSTHNGPYDS